MRGVEMRLYYLTSVHWATVILKERRVKLSTIDELNDPFELLGASIGENKARKVLKYAQKRLSEKFGLICMSRTWQSPVMWAHYGDKHKGVCLGFDVVDTAPIEVQYTSDRLTHLLGENPTLSDLDINAIQELMTTKYQDWSYEREWRFVVSFKSEAVVKGADGKHFLPFDDRVLVLREVILGHRCPWTLQAAAKSVGKVVKAVQVKKIRPSFNDFKMVQQRREAIVHIKPASQRRAKVPLTQNSKSVKQQCQTLTSA
jgi:hypothetical protein